jgi:ATP-binding cassette subfamily C protein LapB
VTKAATAESWDVPADAARRFDPLLECLVQITTLLGRPASAPALIAGLPTEAQGITPDLFVRAASNVGLAAKVVRRPLAAIPDLVLPAVLLQHGRRACVLVRKSSTDRVELMLPDSGGTSEVSVESLEHTYSGFVIFVQPRARLDARTAHSVMPRARHWFWSAIAQSWPIYSEVLVASLLINLFALVTPFFSMNIYDRVVPNMAFSTLWVLTIGATFVFGFDLLMRTLRAYFIDVAGKRADITLSAKIFATVLGIRMAGRPASVGAFANNVQEFESFREFVTSATITTLVDLPFAMLFIAAMAWIGGPIAWIPVVAFPLIVCYGLAIQRPLSRVVQESFRHSGQRQAVLVESLAGIETLKTQCAEGSVQGRWERAIGEIARLGLKSRFLSGSVVNVSTFVQQIAYVGIIFYGVFLIADERLTVGGLIACSLLTGRVLAPLSQIASLLTRYHQARTALLSIDRLMQLPVERPDGREFLTRPAVQGAIEFRDVTFNYPGETGAALAGVSFRINAGEHVAVIGRVGSGKTTIEKLVMGLYEPTSGSILIDGVESRQWDPAELRRGIGYVPQDIVLFYGTVRDNITLGSPGIDDAAVLRAARLAGVTEFVDRHPKGFALQVGERGEGLSGGQRQAIAIARAYLSRSSLLLLDEPSNAMDNRSEEHFKAHLAAESRDRTLVLVTHRASLLSLVDRVIVIEGGKVAADGPRDHVLAALAAGRIGAAAR